MYLLLLNPDKLKKLQDEIRSNFTTEEEIKVETVSVLNYENAVLSEAMRVFPPGPESHRRVVGAKGTMICGDFIPPRVSFGFLTTYTKLVLTFPDACRSISLGCRPQLCELEGC